MIHMEGHPDSHVFTVNIKRELLPSIYDEIMSYNMISDDEAMMTWTMRSMLSSMWWILITIHLLKFVMIPTWWIMFIHSRVIKTKSLMIICSMLSSYACEIDNAGWRRFHYEYNAYEHRNVLRYGSLNTLDSFMMVIRLKLNMWGGHMKMESSMFNQCWLHMNFIQSLTAALNYRILIYYHCNHERCNRITEYY